MKMDSAGAGLRLGRMSGLLLAALCWNAAVAQQIPTLRAGAATSNVTPRLGVPLAGAFSPRPAEHIHDELHARCLVLDDGKSRVGIVVVDSILIPKAIYDNAKRLVQDHTGLPMNRMIMSATHAHSTPVTVDEVQNLPDEEYVRFLPVRIADCVQRAVNNLAPAKIGWGAGNLPQYVVNRRWKMKPGTLPPNPLGGIDQVMMHPPSGSPNIVEPAGPVDPEVSFLSVQSSDGRPLAILANYGLHYVGGFKPNDVSADYFGMFAKSIRRLLKADDLDPPFVGILSNGTSGDVGWRDPRIPPNPRSSPPPYVQMRRVADAVAAEVFKVYQTIEHRDWAPLDMVEEEIELGMGLRRPSPEEVERARRLMADAKYPITVGPHQHGKALDQFYARETVLLSQFPEKVRRPLQALRIGDLAILAIPNEVFAETGLELKQKSPFAATFTISLAGGYSYLPPARQHKLGGFETWRARHSFLEVDAAEKIVGRLLDMLRRLKGS